MEKEKITLLENMKNLKYQILCYEYIDFQEGNKFEIKNSAKVNGTIWQGTFEKTEENQYTLKFDDKRIRR